MVRKLLDLKGRDKKGGEKAGKPMDPETERNARHYKANWDLVNAIDELCHEFYANNDGIYSEDVYSALDRVRWHWLAEHAEGRIAMRLKKAGIELPEYDG